MDSAVPIGLRIIRFIFPILEKLFPALGTKWALSLFLTPIRHRFTPEENEFLKLIQKFEIHWGQRTLAAYKLGEGPEILCLHGWAGRAAQFRYLAESIVKSGYTFVAIDAWAHGQSKGRSTHLLEFSECLMVAAKQCNDLRAVIGHSLGAAAISYAISMGAKFPKFVSIAAPVIAEEILQSFIEIINGSEQTKAAIRNETLKRVHRNFDELTMQETFKFVDCPTLVIHGLDDQDVFHLHLDFLKQLKPNIETAKYLGVGHRRILKNEDAIKDIIAFIQS